MLAHELHEALHAAAALVLVIGGAVILTLAARQRRRVLSTGMGPSAPVARVGADAPASPAWAVMVVVSLSLGAAAIHLAAGPGHVAELGDLGLGFYWAALFQGLWAIVYAGRPDRRTIRWLGIAGNLAIVGAWVWSRSVGLPAGPDAWRPEAIAIPDGVTVVFELALVSMLAIELLLGHRGAGPTRARISAAASVPVVGVVFLASLLAVSIAAAGHADATPIDHASMTTTSDAHAP